MKSRGPIPSILCIWLMVAAPVSAAVHIGDIFPPLAPTGLVGARLPQTSGEVVLVDFWASWCAPCKASFPAYSRLNAEFASKGLVIVAVSVDQDAASYASFVRKLNPPFFVARDDSQRLVRETQVPTMPTSYLLDREGRVRYVHSGFHGAETEQALRMEIATLLSDKAP
jgi:thiol-disulfide isomerase/thioredoxin